MNCGFCGNPREKASSDLCDICAETARMGDSETYGRNAEWRKVIAKILAPQDSTPPADVH